MENPIDTIIAEKIIGRPTHPHLPSGWEEGYISDGTDGWNGFVCPYCKTPEELYESYPCTLAYSSHLDNAWKIIEKLQPDWRPTIQLTHNNKWRVTLLNRHIQNLYKIAEEETISLAICVSALKTLD